MCLRRGVFRWILVASVLAVFSGGSAYGAAAGVSCRLARGCILLDAYLNDAGPYPFLLDTGVQAPVIEPDIAAYLELPEAQTQQASSTQVVTVQRFSFGAIPEHPQAMAVLSLEGLSARLGHAVAGLLPAHQPGYELSIDFARPEVIWRPLDMSILEAGAPHSFPISIDEQGRPTLTMSLNGACQGVFRLDSTFSESALLSQAQFDKCHTPTSDPTRLQVLRPQGVPPLHYGRLELLAVAGVGLRQALCQIGGDSSTNLLGTAFLEPYRLTLNYEQGVGQLIPSVAPFNEAAPYISCGVLPWRQSATGVWRVQVIQHSSAQREGILAGDELLEVDGEAVQGYAAEALQARLTKGIGMRCAVLVARAGDVTAYSLLCDRQL